MINCANREIKQAAKNAGVYHWEIAEKMKMQDSAFSRKLRRELPPDERDNILSIIADLAANKAGVS